MDFFDFLFGKKEEEQPKQKPSSPTGQAQRVSQPKTSPSIDPVEQFVKESVSDLKKHATLDTKGLEAEAIYLAAFLYMKDSYQIDFELDFISSGLLEQ